MNKDIFDAAADLALQIERHTKAVEQAHKMLKLTDSSTDLSYSVNAMLFQQKYSYNEMKMLVRDLLTYHEYELAKLEKEFDAL